MVFKSFNELKEFKSIKMFLNFYPKNTLTRSENDLKVKKYKLDIVWFNVIALTILHIIAVYGLYLWLIAWRCQLNTFIFHVLWGIAASFGITGGAHRLWAHRSYKANTRLKILYCILMSMIFSNDIYTWVRDHRAHHKFSETDADPHNAKRGFFFSHCGWLMVKRHPDVTRIGGTISYKDLEEDPIVMFHKKYYAYLMPLGTFIIPSMIPWYFWQQESAVVICVCRYIINIHIVWSLNSFAHLFGTKPYEKGIYACENTAIMYVTIGEGFHNYHHVFPWDYKAAEFGNDARNLTTYLINFFAKIGWATELKMASEEMIKRRALRTGDGSWQPGKNKSDTTTKDMVTGQKSEDTTKNYWGWDDPDVTSETKDKTMICQNIN